MGSGTFSSNLININRHSLLHKTLTGNDHTGVAQLVEWRSPKP